MKIKNTNLIDQYFKLQDKYEKKYGIQTLVLMQVGSFFEIYGVDNEYEKLGDLHKITSMLNILCTRRNKAILENSRKNALMAGIPTHSIKRYLNILLENNYTIVMIEQTSPPPMPTREVTNILSPGTCINENGNADSNNIISVILETDKCFISGKTIYSIGVSVVDLSTGKNTIYETHSQKGDEQSIMEELFRFIEANSPREIIYKCPSEIEDKLKLVINGYGRKIYNSKRRDNDEIFKINYMNQFLGKIFTESGMLSPIEYLNLEKSLLGCKSYIMLLAFAYEHNENIINKLKKPEQWEHNKHCIMYNNTIYQLNVYFNNISSIKNNNEKCLFDIINFTKTSMGKRQLKYNISNPIINPKELQKRYNSIEKFMKKDADEIKIIRKTLGHIYDIERYFRMMALGKLHPTQFYTLNDSNNNILNVIDLFEFECNIDKYNEFIKEYKSKFNLEIMAKIHMDKISESFILPGINSEIDNLNNKMVSSMKFMTDRVKYISRLVNSVGENAKLYHTETGGYFISITNKRLQYIKKNKNESLNGFSIKKHTGSSSKLINDGFENASNKYIEAQNKIGKLVKKVYVDILKNFSEKYNSIFEEIVNIISEIDIIQSNSHVSEIYGYCKPEIKECDHSFIDAKDIRHPIIERLPFSNQYVPNDIKIGENGILLYGVNGSGKSSLSKAIGLNIVLAQMGMWVPCKEFIYRPFHKIFTRINSDDNIFKGQSSFVVEMSELKSILNHSDEYSIILGDEVCKGTEEISALSIVKAAIDRFIENRSCFIMATHFHKLTNLLEKSLETGRLKFKHLSVLYEDGKIIYERKLKDGPGNDIYGLEIAKYILNDDDFYKNAYETRLTVLNQSNKLIETDRSNYNKNLYMDSCAICGKKKTDVTLHTHHINEQHEFSKFKLKDNYLKRDELDNLVVLCEEHHEQIHHGNLRVYGYIMSNKGRELKYEYIKLKSKKKNTYTKEQLDIINSYKDYKTSKKFIIEELKDKYGIKINYAKLRSFF